MRADADGHREDLSYGKVGEYAVVLLFDNRWVYLPAIETQTSLYYQTSRHHDAAAQACWADFRKRE
jgi:hypothetical protein